MSRNFTFFLVLLFTFMCGSLQSQTVNLAYTNGTTIGPVAIVASDNDVSNVLSLSGVIRIDGDVTVGVKEGAVLRVSIDDQTRIRPSNVGEGAQYGHLIFYAARGGKITIDVANDLIFTGTNTDALGTVNKDLTITFSGQGQCEFEITNGKKVSFDSQYEHAGAYITTNSNNGAGVSSYITMDQPDSDVFVDGVSKVVFSRKIVSWDHLSAEMQDDITISIGHNSFMTFIAKNKTGFSPGSTEGNLAGETEDLLSAAIAFDVSCAGPGRTVLMLERANNFNSYRDGSLSICGSMLEDGGGGVGSFDNPDHIRRFVRLNKPAGGYAFLRVTDEKAFQYAAYVNQLNTALAGYLAGGDGVAVDTVGNPTSRGLWVINDCGSFPSLASNPFGDNSWVNGEIANAKGTKPIRPGFVLGINGHISIYHNTFLHHISLVNTAPLDPVTQGMTALDGLLTGASQTVNSATKQHNSSALIVDGLADYLSIPFKAHLFDVNAKITLNGAGKLILSSGVSSPISGSSITTPVYTIGTDVYDGHSVPLSGDVDTPGEGEHVLDVQGLLEVRSFIDDSLTDTSVPFRRHDGTLFGQYKLIDNVQTPQEGGLGEFSIGSLRIDYTGTPVDGLGAQVLSRPLIKNALYERYNRGCFNLNAEMILKYATLSHTDVSRDVNRDHVATSPAIVGGELSVYGRKVANKTIPLPTIWLENADIALHEGLCASGVRFAVREASTPIDNVSRLLLFNHGNALDLNVRGFGRVFQLGSQANQLAGASTEVELESAFVNVFKHNAGQTKAELWLDTSTEGGVLDPNEKSFQIIHLGNNSNMSLGWTSTLGIITKDNGSTVVYPWNNLGIPVNANGWVLFSLDPANSSRGTLRVNGEFLYTSGSADGGLTSPGVVTNENSPRTILVNNGGAIAAGTVAHGPSGANYTPRGLFDVAVGVRIAQSTTVGYDPSGDVSVPYDQVSFLRSIQPYNVNGSFAVSNGQYLEVPFLKFKRVTANLTVPWGNFPRALTVPFKTPEFFSRTPALRGVNQLSRFVGIQQTAVSMPVSGLLRFGAGVAIEQLQVSGATQANPFLTYLSGDDSGNASIREIVSVDSTGVFAPGEGGYAAIFMDQDARLGLGSRSWSTDSLSAWNLLGRSNVTIVPNGNCFLELNNDVIVVDPQPFLPTTNFGAVDAHRITFFAENSHEIRIPAGGELDLSAFGNVLTGTNQLITIGGRIRLIFEAGSTLRFPALSHSSAVQGPVLYVNDHAELIFEGTTELNDNRLVAQNFSDADNIKAGRSRIMGVGKIWLNKNATMQIMDSACVGIEADSRTPETDIQISVQKEAALLIGDANSAGGILQIGNPVNIPNKNIYFTLRMDGPRSVVHIDRAGILGFGAGVKYRYKADSNGKAVSSINNTTVRSLFNVADITIRAIRGSFSHNQIYDGSDSNASLLAVGPATSYTLDLGTADESIWRGGGNMLYVTEDATNVNPLPASIGSVAAALADEYNRNLAGDPTTLNTANRLANNGKVTIMGSGVLTRQLNQNSLPSRGPARVIQTMTAFDIEVIGENVNGKLLGGQHFTGPQPDMFRYLGFTRFADQTPSKFCVLGSTQFEFKIGFVTGSTITRDTTIPLLGVRSPEGAAQVGALLAATVDGNGEPALYTLPEVPRNPNVQVTSA